MDNKEKDKRPGWSFGAASANGAYIDASSEKHIKEKDLLKYPKEFLDIIEGRLSKGDTLTEAIHLFEKGLLHYNEIFEGQKINLKRCRDREVRATYILKKYDTQMMAYRLLWSNSIQIIDNPADSWHSYALLDATTKELVAIGSEQGNYAGGLTDSKLNKSWDAKKRMKEIEEGNPKLYFKIKGEQLRAKEAD